MESATGIIKKLAVLGSLGIGIFVFGKRHIAVHREDRHKQETDATAQSTGLGHNPLKPGFPLQETAKRESKYIGTPGAAYASRTKGDRFTMFNIFDRD
ncbi:hypothetical protein CAAN1_12S03114 [[Candida] anglica]|uniref:Uncharacterized protein n=1 Tax=[Candida] anglica TaxID=148631 RepID=A0ABP0E7D6_9ASCO